MRMLFVANTLPDPNQGASGCDISVMHALRRQGHEVDAVWANDMPRKIAHPNLHQLRELPKNFARVVARRCTEKQYDVVQVNQPHAWLAAKRHQQQEQPGIFVNRSHGWEPALRRAVAKYGSAATDTRPMYRKALTRILAVPLEQHNKLVVKWSDGVVLCSVDDYDYIINRYGACREKLLPLAPGIDPYFLQTPPTADISDQRWARMLYVGNFCPPKAPEVVADVFRRVSGACPGLEGTWVCPREFHPQVRELLGETASQRVECRDWMPKVELRDLLDAHSVLVFPSYFEGFALTFLQAMARGLCVLGTKVDGMRQALLDGKNGFLFERGDGQGIADRAIRLYRNMGFLRQVSSEARTTAESYTWERSAELFADFCRGIIERKSENGRSSC